MPVSSEYTPPKNDADVVAVSDSARRKAFGGAIAGHLIEWYDYGIYGFLAVYVGANFFVSDDPLVGILSAFAVFALSFFIRPLGGLFFGPLADKIGRRNTLLLVLSLMSGATMLIGALPTAATIGTFAPILLVGLRLIQGFSAGGEISTIAAFISEYSQKGRRGFSTAWLMAIAGTGLLTGALVANGMSWALGSEVMQAWGWRIPFLMAGPLGAIAIFIRLRLEDSPEFRALQAKNQTSAAPLREVIANYPRQLFLVMSVITLLASSFYLVLTYTTTYLNTILGFDWGTTFTYVLLTGGIGIILMPIAGHLSDKLGGSRRGILLVSAVFLGGSALWFFTMAPGVSTDSPLALAVPLLALAIGYGFYCGIPYATMTELFPAKVRSTGIALGYNIPVAVFGGSAPFIASWLIGETGNTSSPGGYFAFTAVISIIGLIFLREKHLVGSDQATAAAQAEESAPAESASALLVNTNDDDLVADVEH